MTATLSTLPEVHEAVAKFAKRAPRTIRTIEAGAMKPGPDVFHSPWIRQGDVYVVAIKAVTADWAPTKNRQLAPGLSLGSRHVVEGDVEIFAPPTPNTRLEMRTDVDKEKRSWTISSCLLGPQIVAKEAFKIVHPRHAHFALPAGTYQVVYQTDPVSRQRVID